ncbi:hypothetical protein Pmar_PMAR020565 [Perkinsus marinus ATCC 50983]|uniref:Uncharacterized protein n=1 Tax=Perkinsus marinus (strain ATCC 50983 / TXsc) TaxID=423536 RepID=C5L7D8_PERM5|nr:hypothetical protein Pmar_PMAR020565 [Perkinsus marinus ATCC 50983]EER07400.1 hypothetical protein Pmar_PMAR020565 [Perkinsus marinus ATCC 50983]|eukprot:XP_002775584.1 hypothetical protein Pmar_PMAR020565 [Perkinsus marinus ATCC 50983]
MDTAKGRGGLDGHRVVDPQALSQSLVNKTVLDQVGERDLEVKHIRRQEALVIHYFRCIMKHSEKLSAKAVLESMRDNGLISGILRYLAYKECTHDLKLRVAEVVLQEGLLKRSDVRPLLDLFAKCKRMK